MLVFISPAGYSAGKTASQGKSSAWTAFWVILLGLVLAAAGAYLVYKYRIRVSFVAFDSLSLVILLDALFNSKFI